MAVPANGHSGVTSGSQGVAHSGECDEGSVCRVGRLQQLCRGLPMLTHSELNVEATKVNPNLGLSGSELQLCFSSQLPSPELRECRSESSGKNLQLQSAFSSESVDPSAARSTTTACSPREWLMTECAIFGDQDGVGSQWEGQSQKCIMAKYWLSACAMD